MKFTYILLVAALAAVTTASAENEKAPAEAEYASVPDFNNQIKKRKMNEFKREVNAITHKLQQNRQGSGSRPGKPEEGTTSKPEGGSRPGKPEEGTTSKPEGGTGGKPEGGMGGNEFANEAMEDVKEVLQATRKEMRNKTDETHQDILSHVKDLRADEKSARTDIREITPKLGAAKAAYKRAQAAAKEAADAGADNAEELAQAEQEALETLTDLQGQFEGVKAEKTEAAKPFKEFAAKVKALRKDLMQDMKTNVEKELKQKHKELKEEIMAITTQEELDAFKAGSFADLEVWIEEQKTAFYDKLEAFTAGVEDVINDSSTDESGGTDINDGGRRLLRVQIPDLDEALDSVPTIDDVLDYAYDELFMM